MADWDEVKRLAADFQKVQLTSTTQRLSERNCIEIVTWLMQRKVLDLIFTSDGKEYLTPSQLVSDIRSELYISGGRVNLTELAKTIGVDLSHITAHLNEVLKGHKDIHSILGQLIDGTYIQRIAGEINEKLAQQGQINVSDLTIQYDLPADFLQQNVLDKFLGKLIFGQQDKSDPRVYFTESFLSRSKAKMRGALAGITRPTPISVILNHVNVSEKVFFSLFDQVCPYGVLTNRMAGAQYIPNIYLKTQNEYVQNFYKQNGYIEFDALIRLGVNDYKTYLRKHLTDSLTFLNSCAISRSIIERAEADIDECIISKSCLDLQSNLPSFFNEKDVKMLLDIVLTNQKQKETIVLDNYIISNAFLDLLKKTADSLMREKAAFVVESGRYQQYQTELLVSNQKSTKHEVEQEDTKADKREERRKKAAVGKSGGGAQGRETKTKSTKKGGRPKVVDSEDYEIPEKKTALEIVSFEDVKNVIANQLEEEGLEELIEPLAKYLLDPLNKEALEIAQSLYATTVTDLTANRRQTHNEVQNKLNLLLGDIRLFEKGIKLFPAEPQAQLYKYLLKTLCTDVVSEILNYISAEKGSNITTENFNNEQRVKYVNELSADYKAPLSILLKTLSGQSVDEFMNAAEDALSACSMIVKKVDKKKDRVLVLNHKHGLLEQLNKCDEPALVLHLAALVIFVGATQTMLHASGRHVAAILSFLKQYLSADQLDELTTYHDLVTLMLSGGSDAEQSKEKLMETMPSIKLIANEYKKPSSEKS